MAIARTWKCRSKAADGDAYPQHFRDKVLPELDALPGFLGAMLMRREEGDTVEYTVLTRWVSLDAIRRFTGRDLNAPVVHPEIAVKLIDYDQTVQHAEIMEKFWSTR